jgi:hypothetical protein
MREHNSNAGRTSTVSGTTFPVTSQSYASGMFTISSHRSEEMCDFQDVLGFIAITPDATPCDLICVMLDKSYDMATPPIAA